MCLSFFSSFYFIEGFFFVNTFLIYAQTKDIRQL